MKLVQWYRGMERFYRVLFLGSLLVGALAAVSGLVIGNPILFVFGLAWLIGGPGTIGLVSWFGS